MRRTDSIAIDCFAGAGGLSLGLQRAGFEVRAAFDFDEAAVETYRRNLGDHIELADVRTVHGEDLLARAGLRRGELALLAGGPPCQGFSVQRRGADEDVRNDLVLEFGRLVLETQPKYVLMENVAALRGRRGSAVLKKISSLLSESYRLVVETLNAADFGVPQNRRRAILIAERLDIPPTFQWPQPTHGQGERVTVREAIADLPCPFIDPKAAARIPNHRPDRISAKNRTRISHVPPGGGRADIPPELRLPCHQVSVEKAGHRGVYGRLPWDAPASTITTRCNSFTRGRFAHPELNRNITMREAARLQSFPDDFVFSGGTVPTAHQVGNAVPPLLAESLGRAIRRALQAEGLVRVTPQHSDSAKGVASQLTLL